MFDEVEYWDSTSVNTVLIPCKVPWSISRSTSGLTLTHCESDVAPECSVVLGGGRLQPDGTTDDRRIEIIFEYAYYSRNGPLADDAGVKSLGYEIVDGYNSTILADYLTWYRREWGKTGVCPNPNFYVAQRSAWLQSLPASVVSDFRHYVDGSDGYVEVLAQSFEWRDWLWVGGHREHAPKDGPIVAEGRRNS